jgi:hypothetical protein
MLKVQLRFNSITLRINEAIIQGNKHLKNRLANMSKIKIIGNYYA